MATALKIEGLAELQRGLEQFKKSTQRGILERALKRAAKPIVDAAKTAAPVRTGALRKSIGMEVIRHNAGKAAFAEAMRGGASKEEAAIAARGANRAAAGQGASATVRVQATAPHAIFAEFGTRHSGAQPFMGPALRQGERSVPRDIAADLKIEMEKSAKRIAARAAKKGIAK
ncbi:HK97-gp10 family putative phage morphogenesis protein [Mesorhizobium sp. SP-1A]|uniref:HK97-gp10 family putative phage morphogenesis protein n=1 Tax=Mesorhizobium sp. SP-1A TaxID=3077840 RepID=UPI0028F6F975|nr:HK97-gp10 family putative phage morphogenesis protein [Mesorhizobium sp. SP-1A]